MESVLGGCLGEFGVSLVGSAMDERRRRKEGLYH